MDPNNAMTPVTPPSDDGVTSQPEGEPMPQAEVQPQTETGTGTEVVPQPEATPQPEAASPFAAPQPAPEADTPLAATNPFGNVQPLEQAPPVAFGAPEPSVETPPVPPVAPTVGAPLQGQPVAPVPLKSGKKLIILIACAVGGAMVLAIIAAVILYYSVFYVSKSDYQTAANLANGISTKLSATVSDAKTLMSDLKNDEQAVASDTTTLQKDATALQTATASLQNLRAYRDGDVKAKYQAYLTKADAYQTYITNFASSFKQLGELLTDDATINNDLESLGGGGDIATLVSDLRQYETDATSLAASVPNQDLAAFLKVDATEASEELAGVQRAEAGDTAAADTDFSHTGSAVTTAADTFVTNATKHLNSVDPTSAYKAFVAELNAKIAKS